MFWFSPKLFSETFLIIRTERDINVRSSYVKYAIFLSDFNEIWIFSADFKKKCSNIKFHENSLSESKVFHVDGQTDRQTGRQADRHDKTKSLFTISANAPKNR